MKINVVTVSSGWILQKIAERFCEHSGATLSHQPLNNFDIYYYVDMQNCYFNYKNILPNAKHIMFATHVHENNIEYWRQMFDNQGIWDTDGIILMGERYRHFVTDLGYKGKMAVIPPPVI